MFATHHLHILVEGAWRAGCAPGPAHHRFPDPGGRGGAARLGCGRGGGRAGHIHSPAAARAGGGSWWLPGGWVLVGVLLLLFCCNSSGLSCLAAAAAAVSAVFMHLCTDTARKCSKHDLAPSHYVDGVCKNKAPVLPAIA
jgi:hypothetical protein